MKFWKIFRFEFALQAGSVSTWLYLTVLLAFTFLMNGITTPGDGIYENNTFFITSIVVIGGFLWLVMSANLAGDAAARDVQTRMHPLTYSTPITKFDYLGGRFLSAFTWNALLMLALPAGMLFSFYMPGMDQGELLPFKPSVYLSVYFLIGLPTVFVATALQFSFSALSRNVATAYLASLIIAIFPQMIAFTAATLFENWDLLKLLDPVGIVGIVKGELGTWAPMEKNTRLVTLQGMFLWNRILWISLATVALLLTYARFRFDQPTTKKSWVRSRRKVGSVTNASLPGTRLRSGPILVPNGNANFGWTTSLSQALTIGWHSFLTIARNPVGLTIVAVIAVVSTIFASRIFTQFGIPVVPTTEQVIDYLTAPLGSITSPWAVIPLLIMYFSGALVWRERDGGLNDIADASPVSEWTLLTGKFFGLALMIMVWMALLVLTGIAMQLSLGYDKFEPGLYFTALFGLQLMDYLLFALLALAIHSITNQKYVGYLLILLVFLFIAFPATFGVEHTLLIFSADPGWSYSDMRGFGSTLTPWLWYKLYWIAWSVLLAVVARLLWPRGREQRFLYRIQAARHSFSQRTRLVTFGAAMVLVVVGGFIFYNTNVLNEYLTTAELNQRKADYELRFGKYSNAVQPILTATKLDVDIFPDRHEIQIRGTYTLKNEHRIPIDSIHISGIMGVSISEVTFDRTAHNVLTDTVLSHAIYKLGKPLESGDSVQMTFKVNHKQQGFSYRANNPLTVEGGTYFTNYDLLPAIGYQRYKELNDPVLRKELALTARPAIPSLDDQDARKKTMATDRNTIEVIVATTENETAVAPGILLRKWTEGNRRYFHYKTEGPIGHEFAILSGQYTFGDSTWNGVAIRIYSYPGHSLNIDRMFRSVTASLEYFTEQFGPYPYKHFTIVERPGEGGGASADASMINYGEHYALMNPDDSPDGFDLPYYILTHEVAHQWWGLTRLTPAHVEGAGVLIEGLAVYSGMKVLEKTYGHGHLQRYIDYLHAAYEMPRSSATPALLRANESFLYYRKGGLAMYTLSHYIGEAKVNGALRNVLERHTDGNLPTPTTLDLHSELKDVTPDSLKYLLTDWFERNTYWRLKTTKLSATQMQEDRWDVTLEVSAQKVVVDSSGVEKEVPMNDWLEVGIFEAGESKPLYLRMHRIKSGLQTLKITLPQKPARGGIDPNYLTLDLRRDDNVMELEE